MKIKPTKKRDQVILEIGGQDERLLSQAGVEPAADLRFQLDRILVPIDFSACSLKALQYAVAFGRHFDARLFLLHVVQVNYVIGEFGPIDFPVYEKDLLETAKRQMEALANQRVSGKLPAEVVLRSGLPWNEIVNAARKIGVDLIVISTHGHTGLKHVLMGSTTTNVVRHAPCPVLTVREHEQEFVTDEPSGS